MKPRTIIKPTLLVLLVLCLHSLAVSQDLSAYLTTRINESVKARIDQTDTTKQASPPAEAGNSTSLVERSSAPDLLGFGLDLLHLSDATGSKKSATPKTLTFSAYALKSMMSSEDPLDPEIYNRNKKWRSVSFTVGYDVPENTDDRDPVVGFKWRAINGRDLSNENNRQEIAEVQRALNGAGGAFANLFRDVKLYVFGELRAQGKLPAGVVTMEDLDATFGSATEFPTLLASLTDDNRKAIDAIISTRISAFVNLHAKSKTAVKNIRSRPQLALVFTTTQRKNGRPDEYNGILTFDKGMGTSSITLNASVIYMNSPIGIDSKGGKFAAAFHMPLNGFKPLAYKDPILLSLEADATGLTNTAPMYKAQAKVTIPLLPGMEIPISVSVANRTEFVNEKEVKGKFGFTFDVSKALKAFRDGFVKTP